MAGANTFNPGSGFQALLDKVYEVKFSRSVPLVVILVSAIYAIYRSTHYIMGAFHLEWYIALPTSISIEGLVIGASANVFIQHRKAFIAELTKQDEQIAGAGVHLSMALLVVAFVALIGIAAADAYMITQLVAPTLLLTLAQIAQSGFIVSFIITALLDEREELRMEYADVSARTCPYCGRGVSPNNRKRHMDTCPSKPATP